MIEDQSETDTPCLAFNQDVTFSADHRVVEGVELARLVETWKRIIEQPSRLLSS